MLVDSFVTYQFPPNSSRRQTRDCLAFRVWEILGVAAICGTYLVTHAVMDATDAYTLNTTLPYVIGLLLLAGAFSMARDDATAVWMPLFWFRVSSAIYFCFGTAIHTWMNWYTLAATNAFFEATPLRIARFNILSSASILLVLLTSGIAANIYRPTRDTKPIESEDRILVWMTVACCTIGYGVKFLLVFPYETGQFGDLGDFRLPFMLVGLSLLSYPGLFLLFLNAQRRGGGLYVLAFAFLIADIIQGMVLFAKVAAMLPLIMACLAFLSRRMTLARAGVATMAVVGSLVVLQPLIEFGRLRLEQSYGTILQGSLSDRRAILGEYVGVTKNVAVSEESQGALARIAYINPAAAAMDMYDSGHGDDTLGAVFWVLMPRVLWDDKPIYDVGARFNERVSGSATSSSRMGYFAEAYYNWGWVGLVLMIPLGLELFVFSRYAAFVLKSRRWLHLPAVFLGMQVGLLTDNALVGVAFVSAVIAIGMDFTAEAATKLVQATLRGSGLRRMSRASGQTRRLGAIRQP